MAGVPSPPAQSVASRQNVWHAAVKGLHTNEESPCGTGVQLEVSGQMQLKQIWGSIYKTQFHFWLALMAEAWTMIVEPSETSFAWRRANTVLQESHQPLQAWYSSRFPLSKHLTKKTEGAAQIHQPWHQLWLIPSRWENLPKPLLILRFPFSL